MVQAEIRELKDAFGRCQVPHLDELLNATTDEPLDYYLVSISEKLLHKLMLHTDNNYLQLKCVLNK